MQPDEAGVRQPPPSDSDTQRLRDQIRQSDAELSDAEVEAIAQKKTAVLTEEEIALLQEQLAADNRHKRRQLLLVPGMGLVIVLLLMIVIWALFLRPQQIVVAPTAVSPPASTQAPSPTVAVATPTSDPVVPLQVLYDQAMETAGQQPASWAAAIGHWEQAANRFRAVYDKNPAFSDVRQQLAACYYNWGIALINNAATGPTMLNPVRLALAQFDRVMIIDTLHGEAPGRQTVLRAYLDGEEAANAGNWALAREKFQRVEQDRRVEQQRTPRQIEAPFYLDNARRLVAAHISLAQGLIQQAADADATTARQQLGEAKVEIKAALSVEGGDTEELQLLLGQIEQRLFELTPPTPTARPLPTFRLFTLTVANSTDQGSKGNRNSCVTGRVVNRNGDGIDSATIEVNNKPRNNTVATTVTGGGGYFQICNMGADIWNVLLLYVPGDPLINPDKPPGALINVNGEFSSKADVLFRER